MYNDTYRKGMPSQYTYENICIVPGGRAGLSRVAAVVGDVCVDSLSIRIGSLMYAQLPGIPSSRLYCLCTIAGSIPTLGPYSYCVSVPKDHWPLN